MPAVINSYPFVSVIIPVHNDLRRLSACLTNLYRQTYPRERFELILVDNNSDEDIDSLIDEFKDVTILVEQKPGSYAARNSGIRHSNGEITAFTDSDCLPAEDWIEKGVKRLINEDNCGIVGGRVKLFYKSRSNPTAVELYDSITFFRQQSYIEKGHFSVTANLFTFRNIFKNVGLFNDKLKSGGDAEWCRRVYTSGFNVCYAGDVTVDHPARYNFSQMAKKVIRVTRGRFDLDINSREVGFVKKFIEIITEDLLPPVRRIHRIWVCRSINGQFKKIKVTVISLIMKYIILIEKLRLLVFSVCVKSYKKPFSENIYKNFEDNK